MSMESVRPVQTGRHLWLAWRAVTARQARLLLANPPSCLVVVGVLMVDSCLIGLDLAFRYAVLDGTELPNWFNLSQEMSLGEITEHVTVGAGALALALAALRRTSAPLGVVALVLLILLLDNSLQFHERSGELLGPYMPGTLPLGPQQIGEFAYLCLFGLLALAAIVMALRGEPSLPKAGGVLVIILVIIAAFFGVGVDALHSLFAPGDLMEVVLAGVEDGGELLSLTLAGAIAVGIGLTGGKVTEQAESG